MNLAAGVRMDARGRPAARGASRQVKPANDILRLPAVTFLPDKTSPKSFQERLSKEIEDGCRWQGGPVWRRSGGRSGRGPPPVRNSSFNLLARPSDDRRGFGVQGGDLCVLRDGSADEHPRVAERGQVYPGADGRRPGRPLLLHAVRPPNPSALLPLLLCPAVLMCTGCPAFGPCLLGFAFTKGPRISSLLSVPP